MTLSDIESAGSFFSGRSPKFRSYGLTYIDRIWHGNACGEEACF